MTRILGTIVACGLCLGLAGRAAAQDSMNAFGGYPTGAVTGAPVGTYTPQTYYGTPSTNPYRPYGYSGGIVVAPGARYYTSGYAGAYPTYRSPTTYYYPAYRYRRGLFGLRNRAW